MATTYSTSVPLESPLPAFKLLGVDGKTIQRELFDSHSLLVICFMCNHCPYVLATQDRISRLAKKMAAQGVAWMGVNSNDALQYPADNFEAMKKRADEEHFAFPYVWDETQEFARSLQAACTPEFYVFQKQDSEFKLKYQGRLDDNWKDPNSVKEHNLADALENLLKGEKVSEVQPPAMGCSIKWKL